MSTLSRLTALKSGAGARRIRVRASRWFASATYGHKWLVLGTIIGIIAGLGAVVFYETLKLATHLLLGELAGYQSPTPFGEGNVVGSTSFSRPWALPLVTCAGALAGAILVFTFAPDAEGHGTDAAIAAVHHNPRGIRLRTVVVKIIASALTIGSGGSGGREGPTGQISAGFGSFLARLLDLTPSDARIAVASGIGSGIGSIFGAPLAGSILATEIMYRDDFEVEALLPSFIASIVGYSVWGTIEGFGPLFGYVGNFQLHDAKQLVWFSVVGVVSGGVGLLYARGFYGIAGLFSRLRVPRWVRPAIGGLAVGTIGLAMPQVLGTGYGWIQKSLGPDLLHIPVWIVLLLPFVRILATGLSIGSGGSGGIFGPGMVIGAFIGASVWRVLDPVFPSIGHNPAPYVIVGMMSCFGSISRAPLAVMLMVAEMTGSLSLVVPAMVAVGLATLIVRRSDDTIYRSQLRSRAESPAHRILSGLPLLASISAADAMATPRCVVRTPSRVDEASALLRSCLVDAAPLTDEANTYLGILELDRLERAEPDSPADALVETSATPIHMNRNLDAVLDVLTTQTTSWTAVLDDERHVVGTIAISDVVRGYRRALQTNFTKAAVLGGNPGVLDLKIEPGAALTGMTIRDAHLPKGVLITAIERGRDVIVPSANSTFAEDDRLMVIGAPEDLASLRALTTAPSTG